MATKIVTIKEGETIFDISLKYYGTIEAVYTLIHDNPQIANIHSSLVGLSISYDETKTDLTTYFNTNNKNINTGYPSVLNDRAFDDSFDFSFG
jgi:hypothetical protein